jgi:hypothetical protein
MTDFTTTFTVDQSPAAVFAVINNVRGWWSWDIEGETDRLGAEFTYRYEDIHRSRQKITDLVPGRRVAWQVVDSYLAFTGDPAEWTGTDVVFDLSETDGGTTVRFTHVGLSPDSECFDSCSNAWSYYINDSLRSLIVGGGGRPNQADRAEQADRAQQAHRTEQGAVR